MYVLYRTEGTKVMTAPIVGRGRAKALATLVEIATSTASMSGESKTRSKHV